MHITVFLAYLMLAFLEPNATEQLEQNPVTILTASTESVRAGEYNQKKTKLQTSRREMKSIF